MFSMPPRETNIVQRLRQCRYDREAPIPVAPFLGLIPARTTWSICKIAPFTPAGRQLSLMKVLSVGCGTRCYLPIQPALPFPLDAKCFRFTTALYLSGTGRTDSLPLSTASRPATQHDEDRHAPCFLSLSNVVEAISLFGVDLAPSSMKHANPPMPLAASRL